MNGRFHIPRLRLCLPWLLLALAGTVGAAPPAALNLADLAAPSFTTFSVHDGLPASVQSSVQVDATGFVWAASAEGLARYDGSHWEAQGAFFTQGVLGTLTRTSDGHLWVGFRDRGVAELVNGTWRFDASFKPRNVLHLRETQGAAGRTDLWALTLDAGLWRHGATGWQPAVGAAALPTRLAGIAATRTLFGAPRLWVGSVSRGLWYRTDGGAWQPFVAPGFAASEIQDLRVVRAGGREALWVTTFGEGLWRIDAAGIARWTVANGGVPSNDFYSLAVSHEANGDAVLWAASRSGLVRVHGDYLRVFDRRWGLPSNAVRDVSVWQAPDGTEVLWAATENGVARAIVGGAPWHTVSLLGARSSGVYSVLVEPDAHGGQRLWVGALGDGLALHDAGRWRHFGAADGLPVDSVRMVKRAQDADGTDALWVGLAGGALARREPSGRFKTVRIAWPEDAAEGVVDITSADFGHGHELWVATRGSGLYRRRDGVWQAMPADGDHAGWTATALAVQVDATGQRWLWATTNHGLVRYDGNRAVLLGARDGGPTGALTGATLMRQHARDVLWLGSPHGLVRLDVTSPAHPRRLPNDLPPPPDPVTYGALADSRGRIYVCTNNGVQRLTPDAQGYRSEVFTRSDGLPHDECNTNAQQMDVHDRYWVGMLGGLGVYDPTGDRPDHTPKPLRFTAVRVDGHETSTRPVVLQPGQSRLTVSYALLAWRNEDASRFRSRLIGLEATATPWSQATTREFTHLPPGAYTLRIEAQDGAGNASTPLELAVEMLPTWWQSPWARALSAFIAALLLLALYRWRVRQLRRQKRALEDLVSARTAALDAANRELQAMTLRDALTGLGNRRRLREALADCEASGGACRWSLLFVDVDHFKDYNDRWGHPAGDAALRTVAAAMRECAPIEALVARYGGEEFACLLPETELARARVVAECIRGRVAAARVAVPGGAVSNHITVSIGVAERIITQPGDAELLLRDADQAMYRAKAAGRDSVHI